MEDIIKNEMANYIEGFLPGQRFYFNEKCYVKKFFGEVEEVTDAPIKKVHQMRKEIHLSFSKKIKDMVKIGCSHNGTKCHAAEVKVKKKNLVCIKGDYPSLGFDFPQVSLTHSNDGKYLEGLPGTSVVRKPYDYFELSWNPDCAEVAELGQATDRLMVLMYNVNRQKMTGSLAVAVRADAKVDLVPDSPEPHHKIEGWAFFVSSCGKYVSRTTYLGMFPIGQNA